MKTPDGLWGMVNAPLPSLERVLLVGRGEDRALLDPLGLHQLELAIKAGTAGDEDDSAVSAVVFEHDVREHRAVAGAPPDHAM
jgi:hypothetical protein